MERCLAREAVASKGHLGARLTSREAFRASCSCFVLVLVLENGGLQKSRVKPKHKRPPELHPRSGLKMLSAL